MVFIKVKPCSTRPAFPPAVPPPFPFPFFSFLSLPPFPHPFFSPFSRSSPRSSSTRRSPRRRRSRWNQREGSEETSWRLLSREGKTRKGEREVGSTLLISEWPSRAATVVALRRGIDGSRVPDAVTFRVHSSRSSDFRLCTTSGRLTIALVKRDDFFSLRAIGERSTSVKSVADTRDALHRRQMVPMNFECGIVATFSWDMSIMINDRRKKDGRYIRSRRRILTNTKFSLKISKKMIVFVTLF